MSTLFVRGFTFQPWVGNEMTSQLAGSAIRGTVEVFTYLFLVGWAYRNRGAPYTLPLLLLVFGISGWIPLNWLSRPNSISAPLWNDVIHFIATHHAFPIGFVAILFWVSVLSRSITVKGFRPLLLLFLGNYLFFLIPRFQISPHGEPGPVWPMKVNDLESSYQTGCPKKALVRVQPGDNHYYYYVSPKNCVETTL